MCVRACVHACVRVLGGGGCRGERQQRRRATGSRFPSLRAASKRNCRQERAGAWLLAQPAAAGPLRCNHHGCVFSVALRPRRAAGQQVRHGGGRHLPCVQRHSASRNPKVARQAKRPPARWEACPRHLTQDTGAGGKDPALAARHGRIKVVTTSIDGEVILDVLRGDFLHVCPVVCHLQRGAHGPVTPTERARPLAAPSRGGDGVL